MNVLVYLVQDSGLLSMHITKSVPVVLEEVWIEADEIPALVVDTPRHVAKRQLSVLLLAAQSEGDADADVRRVHELERITEIETIEDAVQEIRVNGLRSVGFLT